MEFAEGRLTRKSVQRRVGVAAVPTLLVALLGVALAVLSVVVAPPAAADTIRSEQWYLSRLGVTKAWPVSRGAGVRVAVVDGGVDGGHRDLRGAVVGGADFSGIGSKNGQQPVGSPLGHGTAVGSLLAARGHGAAHADGVIGVAPAAELLSASVVPSLPNSDQSIASAIRWSVDHGARVINLSINVGVGHDTPLMRAAIGYAEAKDVVVVASAGNSGPGSISAPAGIPGVVGVSGVDADLQLDPNSATGKGVAIAGPFSTRRVPFGSPGSGSGGLPVAAPAGLGPYVKDVGTSLAAPIVSGVVALIRARYPTLDAANVINRLLKTATPAGSGAPNDSYGYGIVNADAALTAKVASVSANPLGSLNPAPPSSSAASSSPSTPATSGAATSPPNDPSSSAAQSIGSTSSGLGAGAWVGIAAAIIVVLALVVLVLTRERRRRTPSSPYNR